MADAPVVRLEGVSKAYPSDGSAAVRVMIDGLERPFDAEVAR